MFSKLNYIKYQFILLSVLCIIIYANTIPNNYSLDDEYVVYNHHLVEKGFSGIPEISVSHYSDIGEKSFGYRPLVKISFAIEVGIFGMNPQISHAINLILYLILLLVLLMILHRLLKDYHPLIPLLITLIFAAHPIHTEVIASLKNRDELLSSLFGFVSLFLFIKYADSLKYKYLIFGLLCFLLGYLSKPGIVVFFLIIPLTLYFFTNLKNRQILFILLILLVISVILKYVPSFIVPPGDRPVEFYENPLYFEGGILKRFAMGFFSSWYYLGFLLFPHPLRYYYGYDQVSINGFDHPAVIISAIIHIALLVYAISSFKKKSIFSYSILFYMVSVSIYLNVFKPVMGIVGERFVFVASFSFSIVLVLLIYKLFKENGKKLLMPAHKKSGVVMIIFGILTLFSFKTIYRNLDWKDHKTLYKADMPKLMNSVKANELMAFIIMQDVYKVYYSGKDWRKYNKSINEAKSCYSRSLRLYFENQKTWVNLGSMYSNFYGNYDSAIICYKNVLKFDSLNTKALINIGKTLEVQKKYEHAYFYYKKVVAIDSFFVDALSNLSKLENKKGNIEEAIFLNKKIIQISPDIDLPYINIGNFLYLSGDTLNAMKFAEKAIEKNPKNYLVCTKLAEYFLQKGDKEKARYYEHLASKSSK